MLRLTPAAWSKPLLALALLLAACGGERAAPDGTTGRRLESALLGARFTSARLARQAIWEPCAAVDSAAPIPRFTCGAPPPEPGSDAFERIARAAAAARRAAGSDSSPAALHARAVLDLRWGGAVPAGIDRAVALLERARRQAPGDAAILNDLAAAYLAQGERDQQLGPMLRALDAVEGALARDSMLLPALFNQALLRDRLYMVATARRAWSRYLALERRPAWRAEAEEQLRRLNARMQSARWAAALPDSLPTTDDSVRGAELAALARRWPEGTREVAFRALAEWGRAHGSGDSLRAAALLAGVRRAERTLDVTGADASVSLALRAIDAAAGDPRRTRALASGHAALADGVVFFTQAAYDDASRTLDGAAGALRAGGSPAARWAEYHRATAEVYSSDYESGDRRLRRVMAEASPAEPALAGKAVWALGASHLRRGEYETANRLYRAAGPFFERAQEPENQGAIRFLLAEGLNMAGQTAAGRVEALHGLRMLWPFRASNLLNNHLTTVALYARGDGLSFAALAVMDEVLEIARTLERPQTLAWAYRARARDLIALGRPAEARAALDEALRRVEQIRPGRGRDRVEADVLLVLAQLTPAQDPAAALRILSRVVDVYRDMESDGHLAAALYQTALAARAVGGPASARPHLVEAIAAIERQRRSVQTAEVRATLYETVERVFDAMADIELTGGRPDSAFAYLERGRVAAWIPPATAGPAARAAEAAATQFEGVAARLPSDMLFVEYALLPDRLVVWAVSRRGRRQYAVPVTRDSVAALAGRFAQELDDPEADSADARALLFDLLVRPLGDCLHGVRRIAVVPDRELSRVPFAALWDREAGRYLVQSFEVHTLPSALFLSSPARPRRPAGGARALVVGDPLPDSAAADPRLMPLPGAAREAEEVARLYPRSRLLGGPDADRDDVLALLARSTVFHFAGHAVADDARPELSYLALAGGGGPLRAWEIGGLRLSNVQLVVLSACSTLNPRASRVGGIAGLAYSFLRAGAPATVSTLWDVDDDATTGLLVEFHRRYAGGTPAAASLRLAQLRALESGRPELRAPRAWAAFIYTGA